MCGYAKGKGNDNLFDLTNRTKLWYPFEFSPNNLKDITTARLLDALGLGICVSECPDDVVSLIDPLGSPIFAAIICRYDINETGLIERAQMAYNGEGCYFNYFPHDDCKLFRIPKFYSL